MILHQPGGRSSAGGRSGAGGSSTAALAVPGVAVATRAPEAPCARPGGLFRGSGPLDHRSGLRWDAGPPCGRSGLLHGHGGCLRGRGLLHRGRGEARLRAAAGGQPRPAGPEAALPGANRILDTTADILNGMGRAS